jgi:UrcA family protein
MRRLVQISLAATAALTIAGPAVSGDSMVVKLVGINLSAETGAQVALQRIRLAARQFCGPDERRGIGEMALVMKCRADMTEKAISQLDAARVTALHRHDEALRLALFVSR